MIRSFAFLMGNGSAEKEPGAFVAVVLVLLVL